MTEISYSAKQVAEALNISTAMLRRYALAYEELTGEEIRQVKRDGRKYTQAQLETFLRAKAFVESDPNMTVVWGLRAAMGDVDAVSLPPSPELRGSDPAALIEALRAAVTAPLTEELRLLRQSNERLLERLEALENRQLLNPKPTELETGESAAATGVHDDAVRSGVNDERIDRALEVEMQESRAAQKIPPAAQKVVNTINSVEPQRPEHESWITEVAVQALITASELPGSTQEGRERGKTLSELQSEADGPMVRVARWLERRFYRKG